MMIHEEMQPLRVRINKVKAVVTKDKRIYFSYSVATQLFMSFSTNIPVPKGPLGVVIL